MDPETTAVDHLLELTDLCERGRTASEALKVARLLAERAERAADQARHDVREAERTYQRIQEEIHIARFHDVGHLSSYLKSDGTKHGPIKERNEDR
jgi:hypothetical protein